MKKIKNNMKFLIDNEYYFNLLNINQKFLVNLTYNRKYNFRNRFILKNEDEFIVLNNSKESIDKIKLKFLTRLLNKEFELIYIISNELGEIYNEITKKGINPITNEIIIYPKKNLELKKLIID
jgi:hypothetical protein